MQKSIPVVKQYMTLQARTVQAGEPLSAAAAVMRAVGVRHIPVMSDGTVVGVLSQRNVQIAQASRLGDSLKVDDAMIPEPYTVSPETELPEVIDKMISEKYGSVVVQEKSGGVVGIFTTIDALAFLREILFTQYGEPNEAAEVGRPRFTGIGGTPMGDRWPFWS